MQAVFANPIGAMTDRPALSAPSIFLNAHGVIKCRLFLGASRRTPTVGQREDHLQEPSPAGCCPFADDLAVGDADMRCLIHTARMACFVQFGEGISGKAVLRPPRCA